LISVTKSLVSSFPSIFLCSGHPCILPPSYSFLQLNLMLGLALSFLVSFFSPFSKRKSRWAPSNFPHPPRPHLFAHLFSGELVGELESHVASVSFLCFFSHWVSSFPPPQPNLNSKPGVFFPRFDMVLVFPPPPPFLQLHFLVGPFSSSPSCSASLTPRDCHRFPSPSFFPPRLRTSIFRGFQCQECLRRALFFVPPCFPLILRV